MVLEMKVDFPCAKTGDRKVNIPTGDCFDLCWIAACLPIFNSVVQPYAQSLETNDEVVGVNMA